MSGEHGERFDAPREATPVVAQADHQSAYHRAWVNPRVCVRSSDGRSR